MPHTYIQYAQMYKCYIPTYSMPKMYKCYIPTYSMPRCINATYLHTVCPDV